MQSAVVDLPDVMTMSTRSDQRLDIVRRWTPVVEVGAAAYFDSHTICVQYVGESLR